MACDLPRRYVLGALAAFIPGLLAGCVAVPTPDTLNDADRAALARIQAYLNAIHTLTARFAQPVDDGQMTGTVWIQRPGRLRLEYDPPSRAFLVAAHGRVVFSNDETGLQSGMPLARTPLAILLAQQIELSGAVTVVSLHRKPDHLDLTLRSTEHPGQGRMTLEFSDAPLALQGLEMVDSHGSSTRLQLSALRIDHAVDSMLFRLPGA